MKYAGKLICISTIAVAVFIGGCASTGGSSTAYYNSYYDPHPGWGRGNTTVIVNPDKPDKPDRPERPVKPPVNKPQGNIGRPGSTRRR